MRSLLADAAGQEADIAVGNQQSFSWTQVVESGIAAYVGAKLPAVDGYLGIKNATAQVVFIWTLTRR